MGRSPYNVDPAHYDLSETEHRVHMYVSEELDINSKSIDACTDVVRLRVPKCMHLRVHLPMQFPNLCKKRLNHQLICSCANNSIMHDVILIGTHTYN